MAREDLNLSALEQQLLMFGRRELALEQVLRDTKERGREAVRAGRLTEADEAWTLHERLRDELVKLQKDISALEVRVYGLRRRQRN